MASITITRRRRTAGSGRAGFVVRCRHLGTLPVTWLAVICSLPVLIGAVRTLAGGWVPEGDDARVATRIRAVLTGHPPLLGMRSTSGNFNRSLDTHHPGPLEFYLDAPVSALFHYSATGIVLSVVIVNLVCVVGIVVMAQRMRGLRTAVPVAAALLLTEWLLGPDALSHPLNPYAGILSVFLMVVAAWAVLDRDPHGPWVMLLAGSFAAQANLAFGPVVIATCGFALVFCAGRVWRNVRTGHAGRSWRSRDAARKRTIVTIALTLLVWLPPIIELFVLHPNNLDLVLRFATSDRPNGSEVIGLAAGIGFVVGHLSPTSLARLDPDTTSMPSGTQISLGLVVVLLLLLAVSVGRRAPRTAATRGCWTIFVALGGEAIAMSHLQADTQRAYWELPVLVLTPLAYAALVIRAAELLRTVSPPDRIRDRIARTSPRLFVAAALVVGLAASVIASATARPPALANSKRGDAVSNAVLSYLHAHAKPGVPVEIDSNGLQAWITVSSAVGFQLLRDGYPAHFMFDWSYPEDISVWNINTAPADAVVVTLADESEAGQVKFRRPAVAIPLPDDVAAGTHLWIAIPAGDRA